MNFSFNGIRKPYIISANIKRPVTFEEESIFFKVRGRPGSIFKSRDIKMRQIPVEIWVDSVGFENMEELEEDMANWLWQEEPKILFFDDNIERKYYAIAKVVSKPISYTNTAMINVLFTCPDPYKYGLPKQVAFNNGAAIIQNSGTVDAAPVVSINVLQDVNFIDVFTDEAYMRIGRPEEVGQVPVEKEQRVMWEQMNATTGWSSSGVSAGADVITGSFSSNGYEFYANYGTGSAWHGPALKKSVPGGPLTDFRVDFMIKFPSVAGQYGRNELYLLDDQGAAIGKIAMKKVGSGSNSNRVEMRLGDSALFHFMVDTTGPWNDFNGILRLSRVGNVWEAYVARVNPTTGRHTSRYSTRYVDSDNFYLKNLSQVQVHMAQFGTKPVGGLRITDIKVFKINDISETASFVIARAGDVITFDHKRSEILLNGEDAKKLKDFGARFFRLPKGQSILLLEPSDKVEGTVTFEEGYL